MEVRPERLGVGQGGVDPRDERGTPEVRRRPAVRLEFRRGNEREWGWVEEGNEISDKEAAVGDDLSFQTDGTMRTERGRVGISNGERNTDRQSGTKIERTERVRTNEESRSAQGESDTAGNVLRSTTDGTSVHTSIARV